MDSQTDVLSITGYATCPFHSAAVKLAEKLRSSLPSLETRIVNLFDATAFRVWVKKEQMVVGTTSPVVAINGSVTGGYAELRTWLTEKLEKVYRRESSDIIVLSLKKHLRGRWLMDLRLALALNGHVARICSIDEPFEGSDGCIWSDEPSGAGLGRALAEGSVNWNKIVVNCVSDASPPEAQRRLIAVMKAAEASGATVLNGVNSHSACPGKISQQALLQKLSLPAPKTLVVTTASGEQLANAARNQGLNYPLLLKPNAGGFGNGITKFNSEEDLRGTSADSEVLQKGFGADGLALLQELLVPKDGRVGRIWILGSKVLCAVLAPVMEVGGSGPSGCMADGRAATAAIAWKPSAEIVDEVLRLARSAGSQYGSVELIFPDGVDGKRFYFDLNLSCISTMPDPALVSDPDNLWADDFDPYDEMAKLIIGLKEGHLHAEKRQRCE